MDIEEIGLDALRAAKKIHDELGENGLEVLRTNLHGDIAVRGDIDCEKAMIQTVQKVPIAIESEEHNLVESKDAVFTAFMDGIDGSSLYKKNRGFGRYGTMLGLYDGKNPKYSDYLFSGIVMHATNEIYYAVKGKGAFLLKDGKKTKVHASNNKQLNSGMVYYFDGGHKIVRDILENINYLQFVDLKATCAHHIDLVCGKTDILVELSNKKHYLEIGCSFGLLKEAGVVSVKMDKTLIDSEFARSFGRDKDVLIIEASTKELANQLIKKLDNSSK